MRIYLDYNASAPLHPAAADTMVRVLRDGPGNASSVHRDGQRVRALLDDARDRVAALVGGEPGEIVFTSGGTEADNLAIRGAAAAGRASGRDHIVISAIEHEAVLVTARALALDGWRLTIVPPGHDGIVEPGRLADAIDDRTAVVSLMLANNETGLIQPVAACAAAARDRGALVHTDAVQAAGKIPLDAPALGVDLLAITAHKFGGPVGAGALWVRRGVTLRQQMTGGRQERGRRAGTENAAAIAAMGAAAVEAAAFARDGAAQLAGRRDRFEGALLGTVPASHRNGASAPRVCNTTNLSFDGVEGESLVIALDLDGIAISTGSACSSGTLEPSHVLRAMAIPEARVQGAVRFSLGPSTTDAELDTVLARARAAVERLRRLSGGRGQGRA